MRSKIKNILTSPLVQNSAIISVSNIVMYMLPLIVTPILTRLYTPEAFGEWGVFSSFVAIANIGLLLGFENVIIQAKEEEEVSHITQLCIVISLSTIFFISIIFYFGIKGGLRFFNDFPTPNLLVIYLLLYTTYTILYNLANRYEQYYILAFSNIIQGVSQAIFRIMLVLVFILSINGLILGTTIAQGLTTIFIFIILVKKIPFSLKTKFTLATVKPLVSKYRNFPLYDAPASMLSFAAFNLPVIILSIYFDKSSIGCFSIILQLLLMPMSLIGSAMGRVYYQRICANKDGIKITTEEMLKILNIIAILPLIMISCGCDKIIVIFLGSQWEAAGNIALCLALWSFPTILTQPLLPIFRVYNQQRTLLIFDILYFTFSIGSILFSCQITSDLYTILLSFSSACFLVKSALYLKIISISGLEKFYYARYIPVWFIALTILFIRLIAL